MKKSSFFVMSITKLLSKSTKIYTNVLYSLHKSVVFLLFTAKLPKSVVEQENELIIFASAMNKLLLIEENGRYSPKHLYKQKYIKQ